MFAIWWEAQGNKNPLNIKCIMVGYSKCARVCMCVYIYPQGI